MLDLLAYGLKKSFQEIIKTISKNSYIKKIYCSKCGMHEKMKNPQKFIHLK